MISLRGQWPLAFLLAVLLAGDLESSRGISFTGQLWAVPGMLLLGVLAVLAPLRVTAAALAAAAVVVLSSALLWVAGAFVVAGLPLLASETAALMIVVAAVVRILPPVRAAGLVCIQIAAILVAAVLRPDLDATTPAGEVFFTDAFLLMFAITAGWYLRGRDRERLRRTEEAVAAAQHRERIALARELHDVVAHHIGGMVVQAQAAQAVATADAGAAARVLPVIERAGADALTSMRRMVATLRDADADAGTRVRAEDLTTSLHALAATPGTPVRLGIIDPVPAALATSVLRLVQESVTNARRHASGATQIAVTLTNENGKIAVRVRDDGRPGAAPVTVGGGFGLIGMRERADLLGGTLSAGRTDGGGWEVAAYLPVAHGEAEAPARGIPGASTHGEAGMPRGGGDGTSPFGDTDALARGSDDASAHGVGELPARSAAVTPPLGDAGMPTLGEIETR
ncbi:sensor histidine kinase [Catenuloplanes sp. NPDC051500]|uniref:sensor histidine kinase n=1 Tax=Catenuloplanes sp. NPDC051500 TaxID=3363959 RepID=UPI00378AA24B